MLVAVYGVLFRACVGIPVGRMVGDLVPAVAGSAPCWRSASRSHGCSTTPRAPPPVIVAAVCITGFAAHVGVLRTFFPAVWSDLSGFAAPADPGARPAAPRPQTPPVPSTSAPVGRARVAGAAPAAAARAEARLVASAAAVIARPGGPSAER